MQRKSGKGKLYIKFFSVLTIIIFLLLISLSYILTKSFERIVQKKIYDDTLLSLEQSSQFSYSISDMMAKLTHQIYYDGDTARLLYTPLPSFYELNPLLMQLGNYKNAIPFIDSVYIYNKPAGYIFVGSSYQNGKQRIDGFDDGDFLKLLENGRNYRILTPIPRKISIETLSSTQEKSFYTYFFYDWLNERDRIQRAIAVNISADWLNDNITGIPAVGETIVVNRQGIVMSEGERYPMLTDISPLSEFTGALEDRVSGYYTTEISGERIFLAYTAYDPLDWKYIRLLPYSHIEKEISRIQRKTLYIALAILFFGLLISFVASRKLYQPVKRIQDNLQILREEKEQSIPKLKKLLLEDLLFNRLSLADDESEAYLRKYSLPFDPEGLYYLVIVKPDRWKEHINSLSHEEASRIIDEIRKKSEEIFSSSFLTESLEWDHSNVILLLSSAENLLQHNKSLFSSLVQTLQKETDESLSLKVSVTVSERGETLNSVHNLFKQTSKASLHRIFRNPGCLIFSEEIRILNENKYIYPEEKEKRLIKLILAGSIEEAKKQYMEIIGKTADYSILVLNLVVSRLMYGINELLKNFQADSELDSLLDGSGFFMEATSYESLDEINEKFFAILDGYGEILRSRKNARGIELVTKIEEQVTLNYHDAVLSIDSIAEALDLSPAHLERTYKQKTRKTIHELITETRMERAKELLLKTEMPIQDIAENVGYSYNSYFANAFKKRNGMTPSQFRQNR